MTVRPAMLAGHFYSHDPEELTRQIRLFLSDAAPPENERTPALMALLPHAGHIYCGQVIGRTLAGISLPSRLVLLCPNHTGRGVPLAVWPKGAWMTPLGPVPVDEECAEALLRQEGSAFTADTTAHMGEHSLEVLLPFLQSAVPGLRITPICVSCAPSALEAAGRQLGSLIRTFAGQGEELGVIISSDMNHFADEKTTLQLDALALRAFLDLDPVALFNTVAARRISMCGVLPATLALFACLELGIAGPAVLVQHTTSGAVSGDRSRVVGYAGACIPRMLPGQNGQTHPND